MKLLTLKNPTGKLPLYLNPLNYLGAVDRVCQGSNYCSALLKNRSITDLHVSAVEGNLNQSPGEHANSTQTGPGAEDQFRLLVL